MSRSNGSVWNACRAALALLACAALARAQSITWTGAGSGANLGLWTFPGNWDQNRLPTSTDDVLIPAGTQTVRLNAGTQSIRSIVCNASFSFDTGSLSVTNASTFSGGVIINGATLAGTGGVTFNCDATVLKGSLSGTGTLTIAAGRTLTITPTQTPTFSKPIANAGVISWTSGEIAFGGSTITNLTGGTIALSGASRAWVASGTNAIVNNPGALITKTDAGTFQTSGGVTLTNDGSVSVTAGTFQLTSPATTSGSYSIFPGATLSITADHAFAGGAIVAGGGTMTVSGGTTTSAGDITLTNLSLSGGTLDGVGKITLNGASNAWTGGLMKGTGTLSVNTGATLTLSGGTHTLSRTLENRGTLTWTGGAISVQGGTINNLAGGTFTVSANDSCFGAATGGTLNNAGTLIKTGASIAQFITSSAPLVVNNNASVQVTQGALTLGSGGTHAGNFTISAGALLTLGGTHTTGATSVISGSGTLTVPANPVSTLNTNSVIDFPGTLNVQSGTLNAAGNVFLGNLNLAGGTIAGAGQIAVSGSASSWTGGTLSGTGKLVISPGAIMSVNATTGLTLNKGLDLSGTMNWAAGSFSFGPVMLQVKTGGVLNINPGGSMYAVGTTSACVNNSGTINKYGSGTTTISRSDVSSALAFNNFGVVNVLGGTLDLVTGGSTTGTYALSAGATLSIGGSYTFGTGASVTGTGQTLLPSTGTISVQGSCSLVNASLTGATVTGMGDLTLNGNSSWTAGTLSGGGKVFVPAGATLTMSGNAHSLARRLENRGTINWTGGAISIASATLSNQPSGVFNASASDSILGAGDPAVFENLGTFNKNGTTAFSFVNSSSNISFDNPGSLNVNAGTVVLPSLVAQLQNRTLAGGSWRVGDGATLTIPNAQVRTLIGSVTLSGPSSNFSAINYLSVVSGSFNLKAGRQFRATPNGGELVNIGEITLDHDCSLSVIGNYTQDSLGTLKSAFASIDGVASAGSVRISGFGIMSLGGTFNIAVPPGLPPSCGATSLALASPVIQGTFTEADGPPAETGRIVRVNYLPTGVTLVAESAADFNKDGFLDFTDFDAYVAAFETNAKGADFNNDGFVDFTDFDLFVVVFEAGC